MYEPLDNLTGILLRDVRWAVKTAGPSPYNNERTEIFFLGCQKAMSGNPCKGCFNTTTWDSSKAEFSHDPIKMAKHINEHAPNKYITIGGGEPLDQINNLTVLCKELKKYGFHIMVYTWRNLQSLLKQNSVSFSNNGITIRSPLNSSDIYNLIKYVDIIVDGEFQLEERLYQEDAGDGFLSSIGSGNQKVWSFKDGNVLACHAMRDIKNLVLNNKNELIYEMR